MAKEINEVYLYFQYLFILLYFNVFMNFNSFLVKAKKSTYASGKTSNKLSDGSEEFIYEAEGYAYRDRYFALDPKPFMSLPQN